MRSLTAVLSLFLLSASTAAAQMQLPGMDFSEPKPSSRPAGTSSGAKSPAPAQQEMPSMDLSGPTPVMRKGPAVPPVPTAPLVMPGIKLSGRTLSRERIEAVARQFRDQHYPQAAVAAYDAMKEAGDPAQAAELEYLLAKSLYKMGMYHSALHYFSGVLARGTEGPFFRSALEWLFFISRKTVDENIVLDDVARYRNVAFPKRYQNEFTYLLARYYLLRAEALFAAGEATEGKDALKTARQLAEMVPRTTPYFAKARFLAGTAAYQQAEEGIAPGATAAPEALALALEDFKEVVRVTNPRIPNAVHDWRSRELAFMNLARIHYEARQNRAAIYYYSKVPRGGGQWLEALYEESWAFYRIGDYERALGNMITLHAPFFHDEYFPESLTVKAIIYYENCRYGEARAVIDDFDHFYGPVEDELDRITAREQSPEAFYEILDDIQRKQRKKTSSPLLDRILKLALTDADLQRRNASIQELETEMDGIGDRPDVFRYSELSKVLLEELRGERRQAIAQAGLIARAKLERERDELRDLLGKALRIKFETQEKEKQLLEHQIAGQEGPREVLHSYRYSVAVPDSDYYWPYEGEYWRDELGTYQYTLTKGCRPQLSQGR
jgi:outer membrane protein assembly factor BamD (BamD/ComL family)